MKTLVFLGLLVLSTACLAQSPFSGQELSINGFRNPSIGLEYRYQTVSLHAGYYPTIISKDAAGQYVTTSFVRTGVTYWFLPIGQESNPSSFYVSASYLRGLDRDYENKNAFLSEVGFRWMVWNGLNLRLGVATLFASGEDMKINPTPGISYSFIIK